MNPLQAARHDDELIGTFMRRARGSARKAAEHTGEAMGVLAAPLFAVTSALRRARTFHPRGDCTDAEVTIADGVPSEHHPLARRLAGGAVARFSDALTKRKARWPDVLGCALRFGGDSDNPAVDGDQDLLLATIKRPWTMPFSPFTTNVHDYLANDYFAVSPFSVPTTSSEAERVYFRLRPASKERGALVSLESSVPRSALRTSSSRSRHSRAEQRRRHLERAIANGSAFLVLGIADNPWGPFVPLVNIQLVSARLTDPTSLRFDPFRNGRGIEPHGFVHSLRRGAYAASQRARSLVT